MRKIPDSIVDQVAKAIDPAAFEEWITNGEVSDLLKARIEYAKSAALCKAVSVLKMALGLSWNDLRKELIEHEKDGWKALGVPLDKIPEADMIIDAKYPKVKR